MATRKPVTSVRKNERKEVNLALSALTSPYNTLMPIQDAAYVWLTHPITRKSRRLRTTSPDFFAAMTELFELGIGERIRREFDQFAVTDARWSDVASAVEAHINAATAVEQDAQVTTSNV